MHFILSSWKHAFKQEIKTNHTEVEREHKIVNITSRRSSRCYVLAQTDCIKDESTKDHRNNRFCTIAISQTYIPSPDLSPELQTHISTV